MIEKRATTPSLNFKHLLRLGSYSKMNFFKRLSNNHLARIITDLILKRLKTKDFIFINMIGLNVYKNYEKTANMMPVATSDS